MTTLASLPSWVIVAKILSTCEFHCREGSGILRSQVLRLFIVKQKMFWKEQTLFLTTYQETISLLDKCPAKLQLFPVRNPSVACSQVTF